MTTIALRTVSLLALAWPGAVHAQLADAAGDAEIVVTAQKRSERLLDVPSSVSVVDGEALTTRGATQISDYAGYIPGFTLTSAAPGRNQFTLRGITTGVSDSATVGTYVDDAPYGSSTSNAAGGTLGLDLLPYDIERIEVLRGPQGTLYGASTMGGLLKYVTRAPDLDELKAEIGGELSDVAHGNDLSWTARAALSGPLVRDRLAVRASLFKHRDAGYIDNVATGQADENRSDQTGGRLSLLWAPGPDVRLRLSALRQEIKIDGSTTVPVTRATRVPAFGAFATSHPLPIHSDQDIGFYVASLEWDVGFADLVSVSSYSTMDVEGVTDSTASLGALIGGARVPVSTTVELDKFTQEVRLASPSGRTVEWLAGAFFTNEESSFGQTGRAFSATGALLPGVNPLIDAVLPSDYREFSLFGDVTFRFSEVFDVTAGLRWSHNRQTFDARTSGLLFNQEDPTAVDEASGRSSEDVLTYMVSPRLHLGADTMVYARVASGYRPGGPNVALPGTPETFDADELINYEIGVKSQFLDGRATAELALFYIDWTDIHVHLNAGNLGYITNAGAAVSKGVEFSASIAPADGLRLGANAAYTDAKLSDDVPALAARDGDRVPYVPRWTASATLDYSFELADGLTAQLGGGYRYTGARNSLFPSTPGNFGFGSYGLVDAYAGLAWGAFSARLFAKNLTDEYAYLSAGGSAGPGRLQVGVARPRIVGISLDARF